MVCSAFEFAKQYETGLTRHVFRGWGAREGGEGVGSVGTDARQVAKTAGCAILQKPVAIKLLDVTFCIRIISV